MYATWKCNSVRFVQWKIENLEEIKSFVENDKRVFLAEDGSNDIYISGIGVMRENDYLCKNENYRYNSYEIISRKVFPRIVNEDIGSMFR